MSGVITTANFESSKAPESMLFTVMPIKTTQRSGLSWVSRLTSLPVLMKRDVGVSSFGLAAVKSEGGPISYDTERQAFI